MGSGMSWFFFFFSFRFCQRHVRLSVSGALGFFGLPLLIQYCHLTIQHLFINIPPLSVATGSVLKVRTYPEFNGWYCVLTRFNSATSPGRKAGGRG